MVPIVWHSSCNPTARSSKLSGLCRNEGTTTRQEGNFQLDIDFSKAEPAGVLGTSTEGYGFAASNVRVDAKTAEFTAEDAVIGRKGYEVPAVIYGNILGATGQGAAGVITSAGDTPTG